MGLIRYCDDAIKDYISVCESLANSDEESSIEEAVNGVIDYIFKYSDTQQFDGILEVLKGIESIVQLCKSSEYSYDVLLSLKEVLEQELGIFKNKVIEYNTVRVAFQNDAIKCKYEPVIHDRYLNNNGRVVVFLHDDSYSPGLEYYHVECNIEDYFNEAINASLSESKKILIKSLIKKESF